MAEQFPRAGFFKRIVAMVYDWLAVIALMMLATVVALITINILSSYGLVTIPSGMEPSSYLNQSWWFQIVLLLVVWLFYGWFWYDGGQTLGMRAWRLMLISADESPLTLKRTMLRALYSILGVGNLLVLLQPSKKLSLQDRLTATQVVVLSKDANKKVYLRGIEDPNR
jgi:uncharacterized RDD family membrane protein YckC